MGEQVNINRRDFLRVLGAGAVASALPIPTASASTFDCIDSITNNMFEELGKEATLLDLKPGSYRTEYLDDASVGVSACVGDYHLQYWGDRHNRKERLTVSLGEKDWIVTMENSKVTSFNAYSPRRSFNPKAANALVKRIKDLLDVEVHVKRGQGRGQTALVNKLLEKVSSVEEFDVEYDSVYFNINASHKEGDFKIDYELNRKGLTPRLEIRISNGKDEMVFRGEYNENEKFEDIYLKVNNSDFRLKSGKLSEFPTGVYKEASAQGIVNTAEQTANRLTSTIKNIPLENYTRLFERLTSIGDNEFKLIENFPSTVIKAGKRTIHYDSQFVPEITITSPNPDRDTGYDEACIFMGPKSGESRRAHWIRINGHGFKTYTRDIKFIPSTYTKAQFQLIMKQAQRFYGFLSERYRG